MLAQPILPGWGSCLQTFKYFGSMTFFLLACRVARLSGCLYCMGYCRLELGSRDPAVVSLHVRCKHTEKPWVPCQLDCYNLYASTGLANGIAPAKNHACGLLLQSHCDKPGSGLCSSVISRCCHTGRVEIAVLKCFDVSYIGIPSLTLIDQETFKKAGTISHQSGCTPLTASSAAVQIVQKLQLVGLAHTFDL